FGESSHSAANCQQREVGKDADQGGCLIHAALAFFSLRGRWKRMARTPTTIRARGTDQWRRLTARTVAAMKTKSNFWLRAFLLRFTTVERTRPTAAAATPFRAAVDQL